MIRVGIDAGGTFTDCVAVVPGAKGTQLRACKLRSRPDDPAAVVEEALTRLLPGGAIEGGVELVFSTTAATNALLERSGGPTALVTTEGFEDVLEIGRQARPVLYALEPTLTPPLVSAGDRLGVSERVAVDGSVITALGAGEIERVAALLAERGATVAICLLHAYARPEHEQRLADKLRARGLSVSLSSEVCPLPREYERSSTTVVDAYVAPRLGATLGKLERPGLVLRVMESSGGARSAVDGLPVRPARTVLSGPAAGIVAVERLVRTLRLPAALALDVGGTSTDVALVGPDGARRVDELSIGGSVIALPSLAVDSVGAGGGSIAWIDGGGALRVGPRSAGAAPGPAAYGQGGVEPTLTDAHLVLGRLGTSLAGGSVTLDAGAARAALRPLAERLGSTGLHAAEEAARAIVAVITSAIARALRRVAAAERGEGLGDLALVAYGGAAGLHAVEVARELGIARVLVPAAPGLQCALGALDAPVVIEELVAWDEALGDAPSDALRAQASGLETRVHAALRRERGPGQAGGDSTVERLARVRYDGQGLEAELELPLGALSREAFEAAHHRARGHRLDRRVVVTRLCVRGRMSQAKAAPDAGAREPGWPRRGARLVYGEGERGGVFAPLYRRERLRPGMAVRGPALVEELSSTLFLPAGAHAEVLAGGTLSIAT